MNLKKVSPAILQEWVSGMICDGPVYAPQARNHQFVFDRLLQVADLRLDYDITNLPPKKYFLPQREDLVEFSRSEGTYHSVMHEEAFVLLGIHPYDFEAIAQLDKVFSSVPCDTHYKARREQVTIIVSDMQTVSKDNFSGCMHTATGRDVEGCDVKLTQLSSGDVVVESCSDKGSACIAPLQAAPDADRDTLAQRKQVWDTLECDSRKHELRMEPEEIPALLERSYDHPVWLENAQFCYSCGACNLVCPTCYCFSMEDELDWNMDTGRRYRTWDGCMLEHFAEVAGGHNFREKKRSRYRHRFYRKGKYMWDAFGSIACVGCGRCTSACTAKIANPVDVLNRLMEEAE